MQETQETWVRSLGREDPLEQGMATHSSLLAWRAPWTEEPDRPWSLGSQRVRHDGRDLAATDVSKIQSRWQPLICWSKHTLIFGNQASGMEAQASVVREGSVTAQPWVPAEPVPGR